MKLAAVLVLVLFLLVATISQAPSSTAKTEVYCNHHTIPNAALEIARDNVIKDMVSNTSDQTGFRYCTWSTVDGQTMYGRASCASTYTCDYRTSCATSSDRCAKCLYTAALSLDGECPLGVGAHMDGWNKECHLQYEVYQPS